MKVHKFPQAILFHAEEGKIIYAFEFKKCAFSRLWKKVSCIICLRKRN